MITFKKAILRVLLPSIFTTSLSTGLKAGGELKLKSSEDNSVVTLSFTDFDNQSVTLSIEDTEQNMVYYSEYIKNSADYSRNFNFSQLADGDYIILASTNEGVLKEPLHIENSKVIISKGKLVTKPEFRFADKSLLLFHNNNKSESYTISFYGNSGKFYTDKVFKSKIARRYDVSNLPNGSYSVSVSSDEGFFTYQFNIE